MCCRKSTPEQRRCWDLSNLQFIMSGAEPIRPQTMAAFFSAFAESGLKASIFCSAYGLAEHVCGAPIGSLHQSRQSSFLVVVGESLGDA